MELKARNVNHAFTHAWWLLKTSGVTEKSRAGEVVVLPEPLLTTYERPWERVLFDPYRDANPVFHLVEAIWMLAGRNDVKSLLEYNANYDKFAEPNGAVHGAYGFRWREHFDIDQIKGVVNYLAEHPQGRRAVIGMWDPNALDMNEELKDTPCNTHIYFDLRNERLNMTVCCRSNDMVWGAYGANVVHFSMLQELIAQTLDVPMGVYRQFSNNFHVYKSNLVAQKYLEGCFDNYDLYDVVLPVPMLKHTESIDDFLGDCNRFFDGGLMQTRFMRYMAEPLAQAYRARKAGVPWRYLFEQCLACDWTRAFEEWVERRDGCK